MNRGEGRRLTRSRSRSRFDEARLQRFGQQAGSKIFVESLYKGIRDAIENGLFFPNIEKDGFSIEKPWSQWIDAENKNAKFDCIAKNIITSALNSDEFFRISQCSSAKEMWDTLEVTHEGTNNVRRARKHTLIQEYRCLECSKENQLLKCKRDSLTSSTIQ